MCPLMHINTLSKQLWFGAGGCGFQVCGHVKFLGAGLSCVVCHAPRIRPFWVKVSRSGVGNIGMFDNGR